MKKFTLYKSWLIFSAIAIFGAIVLTLLFQLSVPKDCPACGMAGVGLVPFLLLAFTALVINTIAIPVQLKKYSHEFSNKLKLSSWLLFATSSVVVVAVIIMTLLYS